MRGKDNNPLKRAVQHCGAFIYAWIDDLAYLFGAVLMSVSADRLSEQLAGRSLAVGGLTFGALALLYGIMIARGGST